MSKRPTTLLIEDIWEAIEKIERYAYGMTQVTFKGDEKTTDAVVRNLEIIGEAASRLPKDFTDKHLAIEWVKIVGLRHRIVHEYFGVRLERVWKTAKKDIPKLKKQVSELLENLG